MKLLVSVGTLLLAASGVLAGDYVWTGGGTAGDWTSSANWGVDSGYPQAGDTATFNDDVTITSDFSLGGTEGTEDVLSVTIADGKSLTFDCSVSGNGGLARNGDGCIHLKKANPFKGKYLSYKCPAGSVTKGRTYVYHGEAFGTQAADLDASLGGYASVWFDAGGGTITFDIPIIVSRCGNKDTTNGFSCRNGTIVFNKEVSSRGRLSIKDSDAKTASATELRFKEKVSCKSWFDFALSDRTSVYFEKGYSLSGTLNRWPNDATMHFFTQLPSVLGSCYGEVDVCEIEDVFLLSKISYLLWSDHSNTSGGRIDLNGFTQRFPVLKSGAVLTKTQNFGFTSPSDKPANVLLEGAYANDLRYNGHFYGTAGLVWNPDTADRTFAFTNTVSGSAGDLIVSNGTIRLAGTSSFTALNRIAVSESGTFAVDDTAGADLFATNVIVATGGKLALADGVTLATKKFVFGETEVTLAGRYTAADYPTVIVGNGAVEVKGVPCTWVGANGGLWSEPTNWSGDAVPGLNSDVTIPSGKSVVIDATNAEIYRLTIGGGSSAATLTMTNWTTCLQAREINVLNKGSITTMGAFTNDTEKSRVWIKCRDFNLAAGATIAMDGKGWMGGHYKLIGTTETNPSGAWYNDDGVNHGGWGPGRTGAVSAGASHLGKGGYATHGEAKTSLGAVYDDPYAPAEPGSGGYGLTASAYGQAWKAIGSGGGAVRIEASGAVVIDGQILASGRSSSTHEQYNGWDVKYLGWNNQAGSGGAVWINCATITGSGEIHADGGNGGWGLGTSLEFANGADTTGMPGGGGGVAITYDSSKQTSGAVSGMKISAAAGHFIRVENTVRVNDAGLTWTTVDDCWRSSEPGTLYLADTAVPTDTKLVDDTLGKGLTGRLFNLADYTYTGDLDWEYGYVRFGATGAVVNVTGNLTVTGEWSRIDLGGSFVRTNRSVYAYVDAGDKMLKLNVGGNLTVSNGALVAIYAAQITNELTNWGAEVTVDGAFTIGDGGRVRPICDSRDGGAPRFLAGSFVLAENGQVDAVGRGGMGGWPSGTYGWVGSHNEGIGRGGAPSGRVGASHGGKGGAAYAGGTKKTVTPSDPVDDLYRPALMGAGGGSSGYSAGGAGGGIFHLTADGSVRVDGEINVSGQPNVTYGTMDFFDHFSSGAGGTIHLAGSTFAGAATAKLTARGGNAMTGKNGYVSGGGGGGRIALWFGQEYAGVRHRVRHATAATAATVAEGFANWHGSVDVGGGTNAVPCNTSYTLSEPLPDSWGEDGTVTYNGLFKAPGLSLIVQ